MKLSQLVMQVQAAAKAGSEGAEDQAVVAAIDHVEFRILQAAFIAAGNNKETAAQLAREAIENT